MLVSYNSITGEVMTGGGSYAGTTYTLPQHQKGKLNVIEDIEAKLRTDVVKQRIRIKEFFYDFDRLRKGSVGEAGVSTYRVTLGSSGPLSELSKSTSLKTRFSSSYPSTKNLTG